MGTKPIIVGITGGIGSGKSTVSRALRVMGCKVYDCDSEAKRITDSSPEVRDSLVGRFGTEVISEAGAVNRQKLAEIVFADKKELEWLNALIHNLVYQNIKDNFITPDSVVLFIESAILCSSGLDRLTDYIWNVTAPKTIRIERVTKRSGLSAEQVRARIDAQTEETEMLKKWERGHADRYLTIDNSGAVSLLSQITKLKNQLTQNIHA